jgi:outer membrane protein OmpA-like peptidoglycan-associated protein
MNITSFARIGLASACAAILAACNTLPERDAALESARVAHDAARDNPAVHALAPQEYQRADDAYRRAETAWQDRAPAVDVDHLAYVAQRRAELASEAARLKASNATIATADAERTSIQLEARTRQANRAQRDAQVAQLQADATRQQAVDAQNQAAIAQQQADASRADAYAAQQRAAQSGAVAESLAVQLADLQAKETDRGLVMTLGDVLFETGSARLREPGVRAVDKLAAFMQRYPQRSVAVEGFTDNVGSEDYNQRLSERRGNAVRDALIATGVAPERVIVRGYGEQFPVASNGDTTGRQMNRRVEVVISDDHGHIVPRSASRVAPGLNPSS